MANRTNRNLVMQILNYDPSITNISPFIDAANQMVTNLCTTSGYTNELLTIIETWLAAHFVAIRDPLYVEEHIGAAGASYQVQVGFNMQLTPFGQQALLLDWAGNLAWINEHYSKGKRAKVGITSLRSGRAAYAAGYPWRFFEAWGGGQ